MASSPLGNLTGGRFQNVIPDAEAHDATRILICTGKIGHELIAERKKRQDTATAIVFLEQLYPFPEAELAAEFARHRSARDIVWVQEEPANMGALAFLLPRLERSRAVSRCRSVKRPRQRQPSHRLGGAHEVEQRTLISLAFATTTPRG